MKNEFYVTAYRFHVKDRNTLLIQGWFAENEMGNQLVASIDDEKSWFIKQSSIQM